MLRTSHLIVLMVLVSTPLGAVHGQVADQARRIAKTQDDLPRFTYPISGTATALLLADEATFDAFADKVRADLENVLLQFDIADRSAKRGIMNELQDIAYLRGDDDAVLSLAASIKELEDRPDDALLSSMRLKALVSAHRTTGQWAGPAFRKAYAAADAKSLTPLPWSVVGETLLRQKLNTVRQTEQITIGSVAAFIEPAVAQSHQLSGDLARQLIYSRFILKAMVPVRHETIDALSTYISANRVVKPDIWKAREATLSRSEGLTPVNVAIWDEGTDLSLFPGQVYADPHPDSRFDPHGLAFDMDSKPTHGELIPLTPEQAAAYPDRIGDIQGETDLEQGIDSPAADALVEKIASLRAEEVPELIEELNFFGGYYAHGTHVAGIAARGNPAIRLAVARQNWDWRGVPAAPTETSVERRVLAYATYVRWFREHGIRVVNISWGGGPAGYEEALEANGIGADANQRRIMARRLFDLDRAGLLQALESAPNILFVAAAGNSHSDNGFDEDIPSSFELPNLITVGAVDQAGDATAFTSYGKTVRVYASGYQVESVVPGGAKLRLSGTSMAAPAVVNLAAKLLALSPNLHPSDLVRLIVAGATPSADGKRMIINPRDTLELLTTNPSVAH